MKTKTIVAIICIIAMSSCNVFNEGAHYRSLNKVPVNAIGQDNQGDSSKPENALHENSSAPVSMPLIVAEEVDFKTQQPEIQTREIQLNEPTSTLSSWTKQVFDAVKKELPALKKHSNLCAARSSKGDDGLFQIVLIGGIIVASFAVLGGIALGIEGVLIAMFFFIPLFLLALAIHYMVRYDKKTKGIETDNTSAFVAESSTQEKHSKQTNTKKEKVQRERKPFPWGILGLVVLLAILIPMIGGILLLSALAIAILASGVALGLFVYNKLSGKK